MLRSRTKLRRLITRNVFHSWSRRLARRVHRQQAVTNNGNHWLDLYRSSVTCCSSGIFQFVHSGLNACERTHLYLVRCAGRTENHFSFIWHRSMHLWWTHAPRMLSSSLPNDLELLTSFIKNVLLISCPRVIPCWQRHTNDNNSTFTAPSVVSIWYHPFLYSF